MLSTCQILHCRLDTWKERGYNTQWGYRVIGARNLEFDNAEESRQFESATRLSGFQINMVRHIYPKEAYETIMGSAWNEPSPHPAWTLNGMWGMSLRYCTIDQTYREDAVAVGKHTDQEIDRFFEAWQTKLDCTLPLPDEEILEFFRKNRKSPQQRLKDRKVQQKHRRTKAFEQKFLSSRNAESLYKRIRSSLPTRTQLDEEVLRQVSMLLAQANDMLFQAEEIRGAYDVVPEESIPHYQKMMDLSIKYQKQAVDLMKQHGLDYGTRRRQRDTQTASGIFEEFVEEAEKLFDERAVEIICPECEMSLGYVIRHFVTIAYLISARCPRCEELVQVEMESLPDEVLDNE